MIKPRLIKKNPNTPDFISDITRAYQILSKKESLYFITLTGIPTSHVEDLNFQLTNKLFNNIHKDYMNSSEYLNYLFIIEYGGIISKEQEYDNFIRNMGIHVHCLVNTSLSFPQLEFYIKNSFKRVPNCDFKNISKSSSKDELLNYLLKQNKTGLMTSDSYNYKINLNKLKFS